MTDRERIADLLEAVPEMSFRCDTESEQREQTLALAAEVERLIRDAAERAYRAGWYDGMGEDESDPLWADSCPKLSGFPLVQP